MYLYKICTYDDKPVTVVIKVYEDCAEKTIFTASVMDAPRKDEGCSLIFIPLKQQSPSTYQEILPYGLYTFSFPNSSIILHYNANIILAV